MLEKLNVNIYEDTVSILERCNDKRLPAERASLAQTWKTHIEYLVGYNSTTTFGITGHPNLRWRNRRDEDAPNKGAYLGIYHRALWSRWTLWQELVEI